MPRSKEVSRRLFLKGVMLPVAAAAAAPALVALGEAATTVKKKKPVPAAKPAAAAPAGPDYSVAKTPEERVALERQWKQTIDTLETLRKAPVPVGSEIATGALAPRRLRRGEA
jgi:hypothetical protein